MRVWRNIVRENPKVNLARDLKISSLLTWYESSARPLPWRTAKPNPYHIWISEVMSQQSTLKMMLPYFEKWIKEFPRIEDLANAKEEKVLKLWEGLGYYSRARNLHKAAQLLTEKFPQDPEELLRLPGVGAYTAAAIASIAFDRAILPIDGNVTRVLGRFYGIADPLNKKEDAAKIKEIAGALAEKFPVGKRGALAQAFMELGATICKPAEQAKCFECPLRKKCRAKETGTVAQIPATKLRREMIKLSRLLLIYRDSAGDLILRQRPEAEVLGGQWEIPYLDLEASNDWVQSELAKSFELKKPFSHTIMHRTYTVWPVELGKMASIPEGHKALRGAFEGTLTTITRKFIG